MELELTSDIFKGPDECQFLNKNINFTLSDSSYDSVVHTDFIDTTKSTIILEHTIEAQSQNHDEEKVIENLTPGYLNTNYSIKRTNYSDNSQVMSEKENEMEYNVNGVNCNSKIEDFPDDMENNNTKFSTVTTEIPHCNNSLFTKFEQKKQTEEPTRAALEDIKNIITTQEPKPTVECNEQVHNILTHNTDSTTLVDNNKKDNIKQEDFQDRISPEFKEALMWPPLKKNKNKNQKNIKPSNFNTIWTSEDTQREMVQNVIDKNKKEIAKKEKAILREKKKEEQKKSKDKALKEKEIIQKKRGYRTAN